jgi:ribosome biogenesis protein YTM1
LSEVVNHLLDSDESAHQPFDFTVNGRLLRSSLRKFITNHKLSSEDVITIEYMPAVSLSDESDSVEVPSWIGSLDGRIDSLLIAGCYDGQVKLLSKSSLNEVGAVAAHSEPIRAIRSWSDHSSGLNFIATASKDQTVKCWRVSSAGASSTSSSKKNATQQQQYVTEQIALLSGHVNSVESVDVWESQQILLSGDWSGNIFGWNAGSLGTSADQTDETALKKKQKGSSGSAIPAIVRDLKPSFNIRAHSQSVSGLQAVGSTDAASKLFSCSWDHALKEWDIGRQDCVATFASSKVMTSLHYSDASGLVATSHPDGKVRLWDPRKREEALCVGTYGSSNNTHWIAQVILICGRLLMTS